jgi:hypothetical protein
MRGVYCNPPLATNLSTTVDGKDSLAMGSDRAPCSASDNG